MSATSPNSGTHTSVRPTHKQAVRATVAASLGTALEWYDYLLYGYVAGIVIPVVFFPEATGAVALLATFATFAVGFIARPLGGIVLGGVADRWGRRPVLMLTILLVGLVTTLIGLLPGYAVIGVWAPILLVLFRLVQGFGAGAELAGAITYANESATWKRKGLFAATAVGASTVGGVVALLIITATSALVPGDAFIEWGWRIPFLLSAVFTLVGVLLRRKMEESPEYERVQAERRAGVVREARRNPFVAVARAFRASPRNWIAGFLLPTGLNVTGFVVTVFGISYLANDLGVPRDQTFLVNLIGTAVGMTIFMITFGALSDRFGAKRIMYFGVVAGALFAFPYFLLLQSGDVVIATVATTLMLIFGWAACSAGHTVVLPALFKTEYRAAGLFSARELQGAVIAGPTPFIATALVAVSGGQPWLVAAMIVVAQILTLVGLLLARPFLTAEEKAGTPALQGMVVRE